MNDEIKLKFNEQKTEIFLCRPPSRGGSVPVDSLLVDETSIPFSIVVKTLGVTLDADFSFDQHVSAVVRSCFFHVRSLSSLFIPHSQNRKQYCCLTNSVKAKLLQA